MPVLRTYVPPHRNQRWPVTQALRLGVALLLLGGWCAGRATAQTASREYQLKAVFLFNFVQFTTWPTNTFADTNSPIVIGVIGENPFGTALEDTVQNERVNGRPLIVRTYERSDEPTDCHVLFISESERGRVPRILSTVRGRSVLTVSDDDNFVRNGGVIEFYTQQNKIRFRINIEAAHAARLSLSSKLLRLAELSPPQN